MRYFLVILVLLISSFAEARSVNIVVAQGIVATGPVCAGDFSDGANEAFEAASDGQFCTTDLSETDANGIATTNSTADKHTGSKSMEVAKDTNAYTGGVIADTGAGDDIYSVRFYIKTPAGWPNTSLEIYQGALSGWDSSARVRIYLLSSGNLAAQGTGQALSSSIAVSNSTWYRVELQYNSGTTSTLSVYTASTEALVNSATFTAGAYSPQYHCLGFVANAGTNAMTAYFDNFKFSSAGGSEIGAEP